MSKCDTCAYSKWDYEEYEGGYRRWFFDGCEKDLEDGQDECEGYEDWEDTR